MSIQSITNGDHDSKEHPTGQLALAAGNLVSTSFIAEMEKEFLSRLTSLLNEFSRENGSDTPDYILAEYLLHTLKTYDLTVKKRDE